LIHRATDETTLVEGFTLRRGLATPENNLSPPSSVGGGAIRIEAGKLTIRRNAFLDNVTDGGILGTASFFVAGSAAYGGAIYVAGAGALIESNLFSGNLARGGNGYPGLGTGAMGGPALPG